MSKTLLIIKREYLTRVRKKSFLLMTFLGPLLMVGVLVAAVMLSLSESGKQSVLVIDKTPGMITKDLFKENSEYKYFYSANDISDDEFKESDYTLMLYLSERFVETDVAAIYYKKLPSFKVMKTLEGEMEEILEGYKLRVSGILPSVYARINTKINIEPKDIDNKSEKSYDRELAIVGFAFSFLIYMFIFLYGSQVMRGVIEEKTTRIVEIIVSSVKPFQLMLGKILGVAMVGLTQFLLWVILSGTLFFAAQATILKDKYNPEQVVEQQVSKKMASEMQQDVQNQDTQYVFEILRRINFPVMIGMFIFYFLGGYLLYAALFAAIGAAVDNETDTQQFMLPVTIPLIFGIIVGEFAITNPEGPAAFWFSIFPLTSPIVMMMRVAIGFDSGNIWQLVLSMALLIGAFFGVVWLASKIYRTGILMYGKKVSYKELWKWIRYSN